MRARAGKRSPASPPAMMPHHAVLDGCGNLYLTYNDGARPEQRHERRHLAIQRGHRRLDRRQPSAPGGGGFGGIAADAAHPGTLVVTTIDYWSPGEIYRTTDGGATWARSARPRSGDVAGATGSSGTAATCRRWDGWATSRSIPSIRRALSTSPGKASGRATTSPPPTAERRPTGPSTTTVSKRRWRSTSPARRRRPVRPLLERRRRHRGVPARRPRRFSPRRHVRQPDLRQHDEPRFRRRRPGHRRAGRHELIGDAEHAAPTRPTGARPGPHLPPAPRRRRRRNNPNPGSIAVSADGATFVWAPRAGHALLLAGSTAPPGPPASEASPRARGSPPTASTPPSSTRAGGRGCTSSTDGGATFMSGQRRPAGGRPRPVFGVEGDVWVTTNTGLLRSQDSGATYAACRR